MVLVRGQPVQPVYVIDPQRPSSAREIATMAAITASLRLRDPEAAARVLPLKTFERDEIGPSPEISQAYERLCATRKLGTQYDWLARLAREQGWPGLELGVHDNGAIWRRVRGRVVQDQDAMVLSDEDGDLAMVFGRFRFPLLHLDKLDMLRAAADAGYLDLMRLTWFCHRPDGGGRPCGACDPCRIARRHGMGDRIPWQGNVRYAAYLMKRPLKAFYKAMTARS